MTRTRTRRLARTTCWAEAIVLTIVGAVLTATGYPAWGAIALALACTCLFAAWLIGAPPPPSRPQSPPRDYQDWRTELEVARFRGQISEWEAERRSER